MPEITEDTTTRKLTILELIFTAPTPYEEGHQLNEREASTLNQTWLENLRNNFANKVRDAIEKAGGTENVNMAVLQEEFWNYADGYEFGVRTGGGRQVDPVMSQAIDLAMGAVRRALKNQGYKLKDVPHAKQRELAEAAVEKNPAFVAKAEEIVKARDAAAADLEISME